MPLFDEQESGRKQERALKLQRLEKEKMRIFERLAEVAE